MPEGDTIHRAAALLKPRLEGSQITGLEGSHRNVAPHRSRLVGRSIDEVAAHGKHLLIHLERGWTIRTHMAMTGRWAVYDPGQPWRTTPGKARLVIRTADAVAVCFAAPYVEIGPTGDVLDRLQRVGPDLIDDPPIDSIATAAVAHPGPTMADLLLDQSVASGIGNVFKSELLFLEGVSPHALPADIPRETMERLFRRATRLLSANVRPGHRSTTGSRRRNEEHWVYGRKDAPCRRCGTTIEMDRHSDLDRSTYWCPSCQPEASTPNDRNESNG